MNAWRSRNRKRGTWGLTVAALAACVVLAACSSEDKEAAQLEQATGTVEFFANGEDFIRQPFLSKDGWQVDFSHFFVNVFGPTAIQGTVAGRHLNAAKAQGSASGSLPPFGHAGHPHTGIAAGGVHVALAGDYLLDLHESPLAAQGEDRTLVGTVAVADSFGNPAYTGNFNTVNFNLKPVEVDAGRYQGTCPAMGGAACDAQAQAMEGYSIRMLGTATCLDGTRCAEGEVVGFDIRLLPVLAGETAETSGIAFSSCTWEGDPSNPGLVAANGAGWVELTFHSDHIFGNGEEPDPDLDDFAPGFLPFRRVAGTAGCAAGEDRCVSATQEELRAAWNAGAAANPELQFAYGMLIYTLGTVGHCGEGHCLH